MDLNALVQNASVTLVALAWKLAGAVALWLAGRWLAIAYDQMVEGVNPDFTGPRIGPYDKFREAMRQGMDSLVFDGADPAAAVATANDKTTTAIEDYNDANF